MKKSLIALAVAGAISSPAFAATSNVDIYGQLTLSVDYIDTDGSTADDPLRVSSNSSRIGFKGSEDLGGGLKAIWQIENQLNMDGGTPGVAGTGGALGADSFSTNLRNTFVGLSSSEWGTALLGKHDTPYKLATGKLDIFADTAADYNNIVGNANGTNAFDLRAGNVIAYITPTWSGLHIAAAYVAGNEPGAASPDFDAYSIMAMYENGPLFLSGAYEAHNEYVASTDRDAFKFGAGYTFGNFKVGAIWEAMSDDAASSPTDRDAYYLNGQYTMGNIVLKAAYGHAGDGDSAADTAADTWTIGADYNLSKRTKVYGLYTAASNDGGMTGIGSGQGSAYSAASVDPSAFSLGIRHSF